MTPFELDILLHYYAICEDHPVVRNNPPIWKGTRDAFIETGLMEVRLENDPHYQCCTYRLTERGNAYIEAVLSVPLPVQKWVMPDPNSWGLPLFGTKEVVQR